jgi:outer membrane protein OmpA-like peptidoglycan-associated protein
MKKLLFLLLALGAAFSARPEPVDLLDFDQGTVLLSAPPSYGSGVGSWAPFGLSDGSRKAGWCSAQGQPGPAEFVYELEQDAEPRTLRIVNTGVQEDGYPGISARTVSLWAAGASGSYEKLGTFEAPKDGEKEFPVSSASPVRRVKVVVERNWGHAEFTEIMEIDLLGQKVGSMPRSDVSGEYYSPQWSGLRMKQTGARVDGCYDFRNGVFSGEIEGRVARVAWTETEDGGRSKYRGTATFVVAPDRSIVRGIYFREGEESVAGTWDLEAPRGAEQRPRCKPPGTGLAEELKHNGRVVLYGIHFDSNSDVPGPDSEPTLQRILEALQGDVSLKLQIEGHTDSTNTDAYNQALSERRAKAVVQWLTAKGIAPVRLQAKGFGRMRPVAGNETAQGRALNRRVELLRID